MVRVSEYFHSWLTAKCEKNRWTDHFLGGIGTYELTDVIVRIWG